MRLIFALLALAGGAGILLYLGLWRGLKESGSGSPRCSLSSRGSALGALGSDRSVVGIALIAGGLALAWRQGGSFRPDAPLSYGGIALAALGAVVLLSGETTSTKLLAPGAVAGALLLIGGPWVWRLAVERDVERTARIRSEERSTWPRASTTRCCRRWPSSSATRTSRAASRRWRAGRSGAPRLALRRPPAR